MVAYYRITGGRLLKKSIAGRDAGNGTWHRWY